MKIIGNEKLKELKLKIEENQENFTNEMEKLNNEITPIYNKAKKDKDLWLYLLVCTIFILLFIIFAHMLGGLDYLYLVIILYSISFIAISYTVIKTRKKYKVLNQIKQDWNNNHKNILNYKEEATLYIQKAKDEVFNSIFLTKNQEKLDELRSTVSTKKYQKIYQELYEKTKNEIYEELGKSATDEDVLIYYENWENRFGAGENYDQYLEIRKKKAELLSKKKSN